MCMSLQCNNRTDWQQIVRKKGKQIDRAMSTEKTAYLHVPVTRQRNIGALVWIVGVVPNAVFYK